MCERGQGHRVIKPLLHARDPVPVYSATSGAEEPPAAEASKVTPWLNEL